MIPKDRETSGFQRGGDLVSKTTRGVIVTGDIEFIRGMLDELYIYPVCSTPMMMDGMELSGAEASSIHPSDSLPFPHTGGLSIPFDMQRVELLPAARRMHT